jgi:hypothetical protein
LEIRGTGNGTIGLRLAKLVSGTRTEITTRPVDGVVNGQTVRVEMEGATIRVYQNGTLTNTYTGQTDHASGQPGFGLVTLVGAPSPIIDDFMCGDL